MIADLKPYPAMKDFGVPWLGEVPSHWDTSKIKGLARPGYKTFVDGDWIESPHITADGIRLIQTGNIGTGEYREKGFRYISEETFTNFGCTEIKPGDVLICRLGEPVARACLAPKLGKRMVTSVDVCILKTRENIHATFLVYSMSSWPYLDWVGSLVRGSTRDRVSRSMLGSFLLPLPPLPEQSAIVRFLDHADRRIRRYIRAKQKLIKLLEEKREAATHDALRLAGSRSLRIGSAADRVERLISRQDGHVYTPIGLYNRGRGIFHKPATRGSDLGDSTFFWIAEGDLVLSGQFAWEGAVALAGEEDDGCVASHRYPVLRGKPDLVDSAYLLSFFRTGWGQLLLDHHSRGAAGRNRPLNAASLMKERVTVPPLAVQKQIGALVRREYRLQQALAELAALLREYRTRLIADVVTGKLDVREAAARLPDEDEESEPLDETDTLINGKEEPSDGLDTTPEEAAV